MKEEILKAIEIYLSEAYSNSNIPERISDFVKEIENSDKDIFSLPFFEKISENYYALRLGNSLYPHMKLVIRLDGDKLMFDVDTHDSPQKIPPTLPGYERFKKVIEFNKKIKQNILKKLYKKENKKSDYNFSKTVVFLDDEDFILEIFKNLSLCLGINPVTYNDGTKLLRDIETSKISPSICFVDVMMPEISGYDFVNALKEKGLKKFPVVFTTGVNPAKLNKTLCDDYLLKPVSVKDIEQKLKKFKLL